MTKYKYRMIARVTLEAASPLAVGNGEKNIVTDAPVARDINGLPYIPGTSLAGIIKHSMEGERDINYLFGFQNGDQGEGSKVIVSDALLVGSNGKAIDGLKESDPDSFLKEFEVLPIRQHVRITEKGVGANHGKFDEQVVYKGARFVFELELFSESSEEGNMHKLLDIITSPTFRIGSGTRNGFGSMNVVSLKYASYDLTNGQELDAYLQKSSSLSETWNGTKEIKPKDILQKSWVKYTLKLKPADFFLFSSGFGDQDADITPVKENYIDWAEGKPNLKEATSLIPATSIKGAIAHRTAYHWNRLMGKYVENGEAISSEKNPATIAIFGTTIDEDETIPSRGHAIFSDVFWDTEEPKVLPHIKIDKFTGGVQDGALFQEKVSTSTHKEFSEEIYIEREALADSTIRKAFEKALQDICEGLLPLGGGTNRGHGIFTGTLKIED